MKNIYRLFAIVGMLVLAAVAFTGCNDDGFEFPASEPRVTGNQDLRSMPGATLTISATVTDPVGLASVGLNYAAWGVATVQNVGSAATSYDFTFDLGVPSTAAMGSVHELTLRATNVNGVEKDFNIRLTLNEDVTMPTITNRTPVGIAFLGTGDDLTLEIEATDDTGIAIFSINGSNVSEIITVNAASYTYRRGLNIQVEGVYDFEIVVTDNDGNKTNETVRVAAFTPFAKMYLADVATDEDLNNDLMGVPMLIDRLGGDSLGKVFVARYYNATANTPIRFLPSNETFSKLTLGAAEAGQLRVGRNASVAPIVLPAVGYYEISIDLRNLSYQVSTYTPTDETFPYTIFMGTGVRVNGQSTCINNADGSDGACWWFGSGKTLDNDPNNPYLFRAEVELFDYDPNSGGNNGFILGANLENWSPFWRFDSGLAPEATVPNGGTDFTFGPDKYGMYNVTFDTHLNRLTMIKAN